MKKISVILYLSIFTVFSIKGQELNEVIGFINAGNTYREVDEFTLSENYLKKAISILNTKFPDQKFWEASAYENLGLLYRDNNEIESSQKYLQTALEIYQKNGFKANVKVIQKLMVGTSNLYEYYAGIDVGATGIKFSVLGVKINSVTNKMEIIEMKKFNSINANLVSKNSNSFKDGAQIIATFLKDSLSIYNIPTERTIIALSSGLVGKIAQDTSILVKEIRNSLNNPNQKIDIITYSKEADLTLRGILHPTKWMDVSLLDIGSGNTKGGYFLKPIVEGNDPHMAGMEFYGTKTYAAFVEKKYSPKNIAEFITSIETETKELMLSIRKEFDENRSEIKRRNTVLLLGGATYAANILLNPDSVKENSITMNKFAIASFKKQVITDIASVRKPDLTKIKDSSLRTLAESKIKEINTTIFPRDEDLIAAVYLVHAFMQELSRNIAIKEIVFLNETDNAWITGLLRQNIALQYKN